MGTDGQTVWRPTAFQMSYQVDRRTWLGQFTPDECRGRVDYLDGEAFIASHLTVGQIPVERHDRRVEIDDPDGVAVSNGERWSRRSDSRSSPAPASLRTLL